MFRASVLRVVVLASLLVGGCSHYEVTRVYAGRARSERFIDEAAYRAFLAGAEFEARGDLAAAADAYRHATEEDPESVEAWTARGALACQSRTDPHEFFARAERLDAEFAPLWRARADCAAVRGTRDNAAVQRAFLLDPDDLSMGIAAAEALSRGGEAAVASALLRDLSVRFPASLAVLRAAAEQAKATHDRAWELAVSEQARALESSRDAGGASTASEVESAIVRGELVRAFERARASRLLAHETAALAIAAGRPALAVAEVRRVLAADPSAYDARIVGILAAELVGDVPLRDAWLAEGTATPAAQLSPVGHEALRELVVRHGGGELPGFDRLVPAVEVSETARFVADRLRNRGLSQSATR